ANLAAQAKKLAAEHARTLAAIEQQFGVPGNILLAIWGRETAFGGYKLPKNAVTVLATQGYYGRRKDFFRQEFLYALTMLAARHALGLRGARPARRRLHHRCAGSHAAARRVAEPRICARPWPQAHAGRAR